MTALTLEHLFKKDITSEEFKGSTAYFRKMSVIKASELQKIASSSDQMVHIISSTLCDERGNLLFDAQNKEELLHQDMKTISDLSAIAMKHTGLFNGEDDEIDAVKS